MTTLPHDEVGRPDGLPEVGDRYDEAGCWVEVYARAELPTRYGDFDIFVFRTSSDDREHVVLTRGRLAGTANVPVRLHSECLTGDVLASLRCDCRDQLEAAQEALGAEPVGALLYMRQEGRGIGLGNKIRAYTLQQQNGLDTVEANEHLGFDDDLREYTSAALILKLFAPASIRLVTNNPRKLFGLRQQGIDVAAREPLVAVPNPHNADYLRTKVEKSGHLIPTE